jgi:hypothetical protein
MTLMSKLSPHNEAMKEPDEVVARPTAHYPPADISPAEFERFVTSLFDAIEEVGGIANLHIQNHEVVQGMDGAYDFDATVRYELAGMAFLILVEAKLHKNPIKRDTVQVLHQKLQSVGAHKGAGVHRAIPEGRFGLRARTGHRASYRHRRSLHV